MPRLSLAHTVRTQLSEAILSGELAPGQHVPEPELASRLGVSRAPVREALLELERHGLVTFDAAGGPTSFSSRWKIWRRSTPCVWLWSPWLPGSRRSEVRQSLRLTGGQYRCHRAGLLPGRGHPVGRRLS
ncbi:GntR family transcriptional regulator [Verrucomicrobium spinosum]|uniref:GntR family transcriptional regulator n=1 Tax=Verrucomicrobium spinosum TaxID=2736 RepID=UPI00210947F6|nr:GntR family transcriptional regulator [Verrucomicrobium spinosum]